MIEATKGRPRTIGEQHQRMRKIWEPSEYKRPLPPMDVVPGQQRWFVAICNPQCERRAREGLLAKGLLVYLPMASCVRPIGGNRKPLQRVSERPLLGRYLFVASEADRFPMSDLRGVDGVYGLVRFGDWPLDVPHLFVRWLMLREKSGEFDYSRGVKSLADVGLEAGDTVRIGAGPYKLFQAKLREIMPGDKAQVLISLFGKQQTLTFPLAQIEKVD